MILPQKETFCQNSTRGFLHVRFTLYLKFMNNYWGEARFDFFERQPKWGGGGGGDCSEARKWGKGEQRATESRGVIHFINCVGSSSCPFEKPVDLIKSLRKLQGGSSRMWPFKKTEPCKCSLPYLMRYGDARRSLSVLRVLHLRLEYLYLVWREPRAQRPSSVCGPASVFRHIGFKMFLKNYEFASAGFTICTHTTSLTFDLTSDQEKLPKK